MAKENGGVLVLGGTGGLGSSIVRRMAIDWEYLDFTYRSNMIKAEALANEIEAQTSVCAHALDLTDEDALAEVLRLAHQRSGGLRTIVFSSGVHIPQEYISNLRAEHWQENIQVELMGFIAIVRQSLPILRETRGNIVAIGSVAPHWYVVGDALSSVPKAGTEALCRAVAKEEGRFGVRANVVAPGIMEVGIGGELMATAYNEEVWTQSRNRTPLRRFGTGEDVAGIVAFLASSDAGFITGQTVIVDGGLHL